MLIDAKSRRYCENDKRKRLALPSRFPLLPSNLRRWHTGRRSKHIPCSYVKHGCSYAFSIRNSKLPIRRSIFSIQRLALLQLSQNWKTSRGASQEAASASCISSRCRQQTSLLDVAPSFSNSHHVRRKRINVTGEICLLQRPASDWKGWECASRRRHNHRHRKSRGS